MAKGLHLMLLAIGLLPLAMAQRFYDHTKPLTLTEAGAQELMDEINKVFWESIRDPTTDEDEMFSPEIRMREKLRPYYETMQKFDWKHFNNAKLQRQFEVILRGAKYPALDIDDQDNTRNILGMFKTKVPCGPSYPPRCRIGYLSYIKQIMRSSDYTADELKEYWQEWRNLMTRDVTHTVFYYAWYYMNMTVTSDGPASAVWYDQYEDPNFIDELEQLMETIRPLYRDLHAHLQYSLRKKYGNDVIPPSGIIPHHLLEQSLYQAWKKDSVLENPFPQRKLPNLQQELNAFNIMAFELVNTSAQYFASLGFNDLTEDWMEYHFKPMQEGEGGTDCKSHISTYGQIEMNYCPKVSYKKLLQTHGDVAQIEYGILKNRLPVGLNQEACPGFSNAVSEATILSVSTPKHIQNRLGFFQNYDYDETLDLNHLYRMAVHTVLSIPTYFVHEKLWTDIINMKIYPKDYKCHFWTLMEKYMGVGAPAKTKDDVFDMSYKFYEGILDRTSSTKKLFGEFLGYQIYESICSTIGEYQKGNPNRRLHNCDFTDSKQAGNILRDMMAAGSSKPWREIIRNFSKNNSTKLSADGFMEYYKPIHDWIRADNANKNITVGWTSINNCANLQQSRENRFDLFPGIKYYSRQIRELIAKKRNK